MSRDTWRRSVRAGAAVLLVGLLAVASATAAARVGKHYACVAGRGHRRDRVGTISSGTATGLDVNMTVNGYANAGSASTEAVH